MKKVNNLNELNLKSNYREKRLDEFLENDPEGKLLQ